MSSAAVTINLQEISGLERKLAVMALTPADRTALLESLGVELEAQTQERFDTKIDPEGNRWKDIAEATKAFYAKRYGSPDPGYGLLYRSGELHDTIESQTTSWDVLVGATKIYAAVHQFGWESKNIVSRAYLGISAGDSAELESIVTTYLSRRCAA